MPVSLRTVSRCTGVNIHELNLWHVVVLEPHSQRMSPQYPCAAPTQMCGCSGRRRPGRWGGALPNEISNKIPTVDAAGFFIACPMNDVKCCAAQHIMTSLLLVHAVHFCFLLAGAVEGLICECLVCTTSIGVACCTPVFSGPVACGHKRKYSHPLWRLHSSRLVSVCYPYGVCMRTVKV